VHQRLVALRVVVVGAAARLAPELRRAWSGHRAASLAPCGRSASYAQT
jgi:hypothetical protein